MKICVFDLGGIYPKRVSKQRAKRLVASGQYRWNGSQAIQAIPPQPPPEIEIRFTYIPDRMPPREVPGVYFQEPRSDQWRKDHRTVWQSYPS